ncbi:MAG TPA: hypothetical protein VJN43_20085 [Bryobacteraceae bacterium]|nr:hypothetical protein [Bryobacteraceae bacterium]
MPPIVRSEGVTERMGDILLDCSGGANGAVVAGNLTVFLTVNITNKLATDHFTDVQLTVDTGSGPVPANVSAQPYAANAVVFNGLSFTVPPSGKVALRITNLRGDANQLGSTAQDPILAFLSFNQSTQLAIPSSQFLVAITEPGLLAQYASTGVRCTGSPLPSTISLSNLFAKGTRFASTRLTEGFAGAFQVKDAYADTGTRILLRYSGFPAGARIFVPDFVAGSSAAQPTAGGDLGVAQSGGQYTAGVHSLLLVRVTGADATGAGGALAFEPPAMGTTSFNSASEVTLTNGAGTAVYEVVDDNPSVRESAQFPTFLGLTNFGGPTATASLNVSFGPLSTVNVAAMAPIPRFADVAPQSDCQAVGDCNAAYFPHLEVDAPALNYSAPVNAFLQTKYVRVHNTGGGLLNWTVTTTYPTSAGQNNTSWLTTYPSSGTGDATIRIDAVPSKVSPGTYQATVTIDAGPLSGSRTMPVTFTATASPDVVPIPTIASVVNAASFQPGPLVAGSFATVMGATLAGKNVSVTFDNTAAQLLYTGSTQINLRVPTEIAGKSSSQVVVTVDGQASAAQVVQLATVAPAIFSGGVLNQDNTVNSDAHPAKLGSVIQIFATGLASTGSGAISARIAGRDIFSLNYAGDAPGIPGLQQVNLAIPSDLAATPSQLEVCAIGSDPNQRICSPPLTIALSK